MKYMGSKNRIAKHILPIMQKAREEGQVWVEPFVGGGNMIDKVDGERIGADSNEYVIQALKFIRDNPDNIPNIITEEDYKNMRLEKKKDGITGFVSFALSFGGKFFGGYRRDKAGTKGCFDNMALQTKRAKDSAIKQSINLQDVYLISCSYLDLETSVDIDRPCLIYCDPPYAGTTKYKDDFNHKVFWSWCKDMVNKGHTVFVSEYNAPEGWISVWSKEIVNTLCKDTNSKKGVENLFLHESQLHLIQKDN